MTGLTEQECQRLFWLAEQIAPFAPRLSRELARDEMARAVKVIRFYAACELPKERSIP